MTENHFPESTDPDLRAKLEIPSNRELCELVAREKSRLPAVINLAELKDEARIQAYKYMAEYSDAELIATRLEGRIDFTHPDRKILEFLSKLVENGQAEIVARLLPEAKCALGTMEVSVIEFLSLLVEHDQAESVGNVIDIQCSINELRRVEIGLLEALCQHNQARCILDNLPDRVNLSEIPTYSLIILLLISLARNGHAAKVVEMIDDQIDLEELYYNDNLELLVTVLAENGQDKWLVHKLPKKINLLQIDDVQCQLLLTLCQTGQADQIAQKVERTVIPTSVFEGRKEANLVLASLVENGESTLAFDLLPTDIVLRDISTSGSKLLISLTHHGFAEGIASKIKEGIVLAGLRGGMRFEVLDALVAQGQIEAIAAKIEAGKVDINGFSPENCDNLLRALMIEEPFKNIEISFPETLDFTSQYFIERLDYYKIMVEHGMAEVIASRLTDIDLSLRIISSGGLPSLAQVRALSLLRSLVKHGQAPSLIESMVHIEETDIAEVDQEGYFEERLQASRKQIALTPKDRPSQFIGPTTKDLIRAFPKEPLGCKKGWNYYLVRKKGSQSKLYYRPGEEGVGAKIILRNSGISSRSMEAYRRAIEVIPTGVSRAFYPELSKDDIGFDHFYADGFREVYVGANLASIKVERLPEELRASIYEQKRWILSALIFRQIRHCHPHDKNFNVRFLLEEEEGNKSILFDINKAIELTVKSKTTTLTPIVTLRDWDAGSLAQ